MANKKIIELDAASQINSDALFAVSQQVSSEQKTLKGTVEQVGDYIAGQQTFSGLNTTSKKLIGAINEAASSNASIETALTTPVSLASFADGGENIPLKALKVLVTAVQAGSGIPSPSNVRTISGFSACNLTRCGKNLFKASDWLTLDTYYSENSSGTINVLKTDTRAWSDLTEHFIKAGTYAFTRSSLGLGNYAYRLKSENYSVDHGIGISQSVTIAQDDYIKIKLGYNASSYPFELSFKIEVGNATTGFEKYNGTQVTIPFGQTVYGGTLDVLTGLLTVTHGIVDLGTLTWSYLGSGDTARFLSEVISDIKKPSLNTTPDCICSNYPVLLYNQSYTTDKSSGVYSDGNIIVKDSSYTDTTTFQTAMSGVKFVYELATPTTIQLTPTEVKTLLGQNNIFADCGDIDTLIYFNNNANEISDLVVAYVGDITNLYATLATGNTSVTITNPAIKKNSTIDIYCDPDTLYNSVTVTDGQIVIAFDAQASDVKVKVRLS